MIIALEFDGVFASNAYPNIGNDIGAIPVLKELVASGHSLVLDTFRQDAELTHAVKWIMEKGVFISSINVNPTQHVFTSSPKIFADLYINPSALGAPIKNDPINGRHIDWFVARMLLASNGLLK